MKPVKSKNASGKSSIIELPIMLVVGVLNIITFLGRILLEIFNFFNTDLIVDLSEMDKKGKKDKELGTIFKTICFLIGLSIIGLVVWATIGD